MGTGPAVGPGYDLALTERIDDGGRRYVVDVGSDDGAEVLAALPHRDAEQAVVDSARGDVAEAAHHMGRQMPAGDLRNLLVQSRESPRWDDVASRCLTCGNCAMVCPPASAPASRMSPISAVSTLSDGWIGRRASSSTSRTYTRAACGSRAVALPALADPQARHLARPVRHLGMRGLWALYRLVPHWD